MYKEGADLIKITASGGVLSLEKDGTGPQFSEEEIRAIVETAKDYGMPVAAHAHGAEAMKRAIRAGVTSIEHGTLMDDETIDLFKKYGTWVRPHDHCGQVGGRFGQKTGIFPSGSRARQWLSGPSSKALLQRRIRLA